MKVYKTGKGILVESKNQYFLLNEDWDKFINNDKIYTETQEKIKKLSPFSDYEELLKNQLLPPIGTQEIWASGVTNLRSKSARMEESKETGGGDFYDRVYHAERPELFFKSAYHRVSGSIFIQDTLE